MVIKSLTAYSNEVRKHDRFEPRFHLIQEKIKKIESSSKYEVIKLGDSRLLSDITDGEHAGQKFVKKGIRFVKNSAVRDFSINLLDGFYISEQKHYEQKRSALREENVLFTTIGHLGSACIVPKDFGEANINQNVVKITINKDFLDPYYLTAYLNSLITKEQIFSYFTGNLQRILTYPKIKNIRVIIPSEGTITNLSKKYQEAIQHQFEAMKLIKEAQDIFYKTVTFESTNYSDNTTMFSTNLSNFVDFDLWTPKYSNPFVKKILQQIENSVTMVPLWELATIKKGNEIGSSNYREYHEKNEEDIPFVRTSDLINYEVDLFPDYYADPSIYTELDQDITDCDVLFSNDGKIGLVAMITPQDQIILQSHIRRIRLKKPAIEKYKISQEYLFLMLTIKEIAKFQAYRFTVVQSTIPTISKNLGNFLIPILPKEDILAITSKIRTAFLNKSKRKKILKDLRLQIDHIDNTD